MGATHASVRSRRCRTCGLTAHPSIVAQVRRGRTGQPCGVDHAGGRPAAAPHAGDTRSLDIRDRFEQFPAPRPRKPWPVADITGKRKLLAQNVSHSNIKTKRWQNVNIQTRRVWVPELNRFVTLQLTTRDIRTIDKVGVTAYAKRHGVTL